MSKDKKIRIGLILVGVSLTLLVLGLYIMYMLSAGVGSNSGYSGLGAGFLGLFIIVFGGAVVSVLGTIGLFLIFVGLVRKKTIEANDKQSSVPKT